MSQLTVRTTQEAATAALETLDRLAAARTVVEAMVMGRWLLDPEVVHQLGRLVDSAESWSRRAAA